MSATLQFLDNHSINEDGIRKECEQGLLQNLATFPPKLFYDLLGSKLFDLITYLPEYYLTSLEESIFSENRDAICNTIGKNIDFIDLGAGNCMKAASFFNALEPSKYVAVDISVDFLKNILPNLQKKYPLINMLGVGMDFSSKLEFPTSMNEGRKIFFYPGSSLGNFTKNDALILLKQIHQNLNGGGLLLGIDLWKDESILRLAYDDPLMITAAFNRNILRTVNHILGSNFDIRDFAHHVIINVQSQRVELYLEALNDVTITWPNHQRTFVKGELIHTENSHKYSLDGIQALLSEAGFGDYTVWTDPQKYYAVIYAHEKATDDYTS